MRIAVTGTPGVGKTTIARRLADDLGAEYFSVSKEVSGGASAGYDEERDVPVADVEALRNTVPKDEDIVLDGHLSHRLEPDAAVVLRCRPDVLRSRLEERGWEDEKVRENVESEALDVLLAEALGTDASVFEFDTTDTTPEKTVESVLRTLEEDEERFGVVDWSMNTEVRN